VAHEPRTVYPRPDRSEEIDDPLIVAQSMIHFENDVGPFRSQFTLAPMSFSMSEEYIQLRTGLTSTLITAQR
jgi:hypothetical protein